MQEGKQSQASDRPWPVSLPRPPQTHYYMDHRVPTSLNAIQFPQECAGKLRLGRLNYRSENNCFSCLNAASHSVVLPRESPCFAPRVFQGRPTLFENHHFPSFSLSFPQSARSPASINFCNNLHLKGSFPHPMGSQKVSKVGIRTRNPCLYSGKCSPRLLEGARRSAPFTCR